jgi:hypothetical protein
MRRGAGSPRLRGARAAEGCQNSDSSPNWGFDTLHGGLARRWEKAGHTVTRIGREGGDASDAELSSWPCRPASSPTRSARCAASTARSSSTRRARSAAAMREREGRGAMEIGEPRRTVTVEPLEEPVPRKCRDDRRAFAGVTLAATQQLGRGRAARFARADPAARRCRRSTASAPILARTSLAELGEAKRFHRERQAVRDAQIRSCCNSSVSCLPRGGSDQQGTTSARGVVGKASGEASERVLEHNAD